MELPYIAFNFMTSHKTKSWRYVWFYHTKNVLNKESYLWLTCWLAALHKWPAPEIKCFLFVLNARASVKQGLFYPTTKIKRFYVKISRTKFQSIAKISLWQTDCKTLLQCSFTLDSKIHGNTATYIFGQMWTRVSTQQCSLSTIIVMLVTLLNFHLTKNFISQLTQDQISDWEAGESKRAFCHSLHLRLFSFFITSVFCSILVLKGQMELFLEFIVSIRHLKSIT